MKTFLILLLSLITFESWADCSSPISRTNVSANTVLTSTKYNTDVNTVYNHVNSLDGDCIDDSSVNKTKLEAGYKDLAVAAKTSAYTATSSDEVLTADSSGGAFTITLPTAVGISGRKYVIKKTDSSFNAVTIDANSAETIDGALTKALS